MTIKTEKTNAVTAGMYTSAITCTIQRVVYIIQIKPMSNVTTSKQKSHDQKIYCKLSKRVTHIKLSFDIVDNCNVHVIQKDMHYKRINVQTLNMCNVKH